MDPKRPLYPQRVGGKVDFSDFVNFFGCQGTLRLALTAKEIVKITEGVAANRFDASRHAGNGMLSQCAVYVTLVVGRSLVGAFGASLTWSAPSVPPSKPPKTSKPIS